MKLLQVCNIVSPHQMPLARSFAQLMGPENFRFAAMQLPDHGRLAMGWDCSSDETWVLQAEQNNEVRRSIQEWWAEADIVLCGERELDQIEKRLVRRKLTFYMSERWWKPPLGMFRLAHPKYARMALRFQRLARFREFNYCAVGYHAAADMKRWASFVDRSWLWGYFTGTPSPRSPLATRAAGFDVLYAGRMLGWKRVDTLIRAFDLLWRHDANARLVLIGDGPKRSELQRLASRLGLSNAVSFEPSQPMSEVWRRMSSCHAYVLPSDGYEGWGAVVNEAMAMGCPVVVSDAGGAGRTLIEHGQSGLLFRPGDWRHLAALLTFLDDHESARLGLAEVGQRSIVEDWSPKEAATRFLSVCAALLSRRAPPSFRRGPMRRL